jgi:hypothetical protein
VVIELKLRHSSPEQTLSECLAQTWTYMDRCGTVEGRLVIFDWNIGKSWEEKILQRKEIYQGQTIMVWGM